MRKKDELARPDTCMAHAHPEEMVFVLLGRDPAAPVAIRTWAQERVRLEKNRGDDSQVLEAYDCARTMETEGRRWADAPPAAAIVDQPPPVKRTDRRPAWDMVREDLRKLREVHAESIQIAIDLVLADAAERDRVGRKRYGVPLTAGNGRDHLIDAYFEALDLAAYLRAEIDEREQALVLAIYERHLDTMIALRELIARRHNAQRVAKEP